jgi:hypothetical protein
MDRYARETAHRTFSRQDPNPTSDLPSESIDYDADTVELDAPPPLAARPADEPTQVSVTVQVHGARSAAPPAVQVSTGATPVQSAPATPAQSAAASPPRQDPREQEFPGPRQHARAKGKREPGSEHAPAEPIERKAQPREKVAPAARQAPASSKPATPADSAAFLEGETIRGRYVLEEQIGSGGTSRVFRARDLRRDPMFDRDGYVALKVTRESLRDRRDIAERLKREFHQTQALAHPNIVRALDIDCEDGAWFITMELLDGESLSTVLSCLQPQVLPQHEAMSILRGCGEALAFAHDRGVLHCDFKPGNVFVTRSEDVRVLDFGVAAPGTSSERGEEPTRVTAATPCYASPDILEGHPPDERDDVFSFACVAYEVLTGRHPFERRSTLEAREQGMMVQRMPGLTRRQHRVLERALSWSRRPRPGSIRELMLALGLTESYHPSSVGWLKAGATLAAGAVIAAVLFNLYESREDRQAERQASATTQQPRTIQWAAASPAERREREAQLAAESRSAGTPPVAGTAEKPATASRRGTLQEPAPSSGRVTQEQATSSNRPASASPSTQRVAKAAAPAGVSAAASPIQSFPIDESPAARTVADSTGVAQEPRAAAANRISFEQARIVASEGAVSAVLRVRRLDDLSGRVRIQWRAIPGDAQPSSDYSMDGIGTIDIPEGQDLRVVYIPILNDRVRESNESFDVELFDVSGPGSLEPITRATVTILDNDR